MRVMMCVIGVLVLAATPAIASTSVFADVPFPFELGGIVLRPGEYVFTLDRGILVQIAERNGPPVANVLTSPHDYNRNEELKIVFNKYGDRIFLAQVWLPGAAMNVQRSRQERELVVSRMISAVEVVIPARKA
jgi:hypothetical protein